MEERDTETVDGWSERLTAAVVASITAHREAKGWKVQELADRCTAVGYPMKRTTLSNLESGLRKSIALHELLVLAFTLDVPPAVLAVPLGKTDLFELLPGQHIPTPDAFRLLTGAVGHGSEGVKLFARHTERGEDVLAAGMRAAQLRRWALDDPSEEERLRLEGRAERAEQDGRDAEQGLLVCRAEMAVAGLLLPPLPAALAYLEEEGGNDAS